MVFVLVSVPPLPVTLPLVSVSVLTVSLLPPMANVAPFTSRFVLSSIRSVPPSVKVPAPLSSMVPVPAFNPVVSIVMDPAVLKNWLPFPEVVVLRFVPETTIALPLAPMPPDPALSRIVPAPTMMSVVAVPEVIAPMPLVVSVMLPPAEVSEGVVPLKAISLPLPVVKLRFVADVRSIADEIVTVPDDVSPIEIAPAVMRSSSGSVRLSLPEVSVPKSI